ncbi:MAG TPA: hypothetical protein VE326_09870, partial [Candidatus Binatia bacterium]|nr:hypothetical protein [Candidatus Binatia bacterium]
MNLRTFRDTVAAAAAAALTLFFVAHRATAGTTGTAGTTKPSVSVGTVSVVTPTAAGPETSAAVPGTPAAKAPAAKPAAVPSKSHRTKKSAAKPAPAPNEAVKAPAADAKGPATASAAPAAPATGATDAPAPDAKDGEKGYTIKGGAERTDLRSLTIEGEDRVHVEIERPPLALQLDPAKVNGLDFGTAEDVLDRTPPDLTTGFLAVSASERSPYTGRPWLRQFASGSVARFQPNVRGTERWKLTVADSHGQTVAQFGGKGEAPKEIVWDGRALSGAPVTPGITYSYVFEAVDKAGNKRNFVGQGFKVSAYRLDSPLGPTLVFSAQTLQEGAVATAYGPTGAATRPAPPIVLEAASTLNQSPRVSQPIRVDVTGRTYEYANATAKQVAAWIAALTIGDPTRVQAVASVEPDAP